MIKYITMCLMAVISLIVLLATRPQGTAERTIDVSVIERNLVTEKLQAAMDKQAEIQAEEELEEMRFELEKNKFEVQDKKRSSSSTSRGGTTRKIPKGNTSMKTYMSYKKITNKTSNQYALQQIDNIYTDSEGFRRIDDKFIIAIGTFFQASVGQEVVVKLSDGGTFNAYIGDIKDNRHTDETNLKHKVDGSVVEFLIHNEKLDKTIKKMGDCSYSKLNDFKGDVVSIEVIEDSNILN